MERWPWSAACTSAVRPRLLGRSMLAPRFSSSLTICRWLLAAAACSRVEVVGRPSSVRSADRVGLSSLAQPLDHLLQLAPLRRPVDLFGKWGGRAHRCSASLGAAGEAESGGPTCEPAAARARRPSLGRRRPVAQREAEQSAQPATRGWGFYNRRDGGALRLKD